MLRIKWHPLKQLQEEAKLDHTISPTHCNTKAVCFNLFVNTMTQTIIRMPRNNATQGITEDHWEVPTSYGWALFSRIWDPVQVQCLSLFGHIAQMPDETDAKKILEASPWRTEPL